MSDTLRLMRFHYLAEEIGIRLANGSDWFEREPRQVWNTTVDLLNDLNREMIEAPSSTGATFDELDWRSVTTMRTNHPSDCGWGHDNGCRMGMIILEAFPVNSPSLHRDALRFMQTFEHRLAVTVERAT